MPQRTAISTSTSTSSTRTTVQGRRSPAVSAAQAAADREVEALGQQIVELMDRVRQSEERTAYAEQQLVHMTHMANAAAAAAEALPARSAEFDFSPPKAAARAWLPWTIVGGLAALVVAGFLLGYSPLQTQYEAALEQIEELTARHTQEVASLKMTLSDEKQRFESQLAAAQTAAAAAAAAAAPAEDTSPSSRSSYSRSRESSDDDGEDRSARSEERAAKAEERKALYEERKAARLAKREERRAAAEERKAERAARAEERKAKRSSSSGDDSEDLPPPKKSNINPWATSVPSGGGSNDPLEGL